MPPLSIVLQVVYIVEKKHSRAVTGFLKFLPDKPFAMFSPWTTGQLAKTLGQAGEIEPETEGILIEYEVDFTEFSTEVKECIFTIDPATARDLDDALSCKLLPDGNFELGVHIADVSYFVGEDNALDSIASRRATSVYMVQKVIPMLPRLLCEELCSLNPLIDRLTFSVIWKITPEGKILSEWFGRSVIRSCVKLSYDHAQSMIDAPDKMFSAEELPPTDPEHPIDEIHQAVLHLHSIAKNLRAQRFSGGALRLDQLALLRRHPPPKAKMAEELQELCDQLGIDIDLSSAGALHKSLHTTLGDDEYTAARKEVLTHMCSRPMQMALYFCSGTLKTEDLFKHYALNVPLYTHFTSPIRRYADIIDVEKQASHCNERKTLSKRVQELSSELFFAVFVKDCGPLDSEAMVMGVLDQSFDVLVLRYGVQKRVYCKSITGLSSFRHHKVGKKSELTLLWIPEDLNKAPVEQVISIFTLVEVQLKADGAPMKYSAVLKRPEEKEE
ncbi:hypothetical protein F7725_011747 [Dissostichus mawsoni]|uniref:RNB domain-containing protein n=1 Tax=Dissostichus mawsoni TaxID=36200 RepID=A0A7J5ZA33_DISMA|nr:hypothetical protein F7725_011747 [Dissostichus mawsoni]